MNCSEWNTTKEKQMNEIVQELINGKHDDVFTKEERDEVIKENINDTKQIRKAYEIQRTAEGRKELLNKFVFYNKVA